MTTSGASWVVVPDQDRGRGGNSPPSDNREWTALERGLQLFREATMPMTAADLKDDAIMAQYATSTIMEVPGKLRNQGLLEEIGKRGRHTTWAINESGRAVDVVPRPTAQEDLSRRALRIIDDLLSDLDLREGVRRHLEGRKGRRDTQALLRALEKDEQADQLAAERRAADLERERLRMIEIRRDQAAKSVDVWDRLITETKAYRAILATYLPLVNDLPATHASFIRSLDREMQVVRSQLAFFEDRLRSRDNGGLRKGNIIDV